MAYNNLIRIGIKFYCMADENEYLWDFWFYAGAESMRSNQPQVIVTDFVDSLVKEFPGRPYIIVTDSYYSGFQLAEELHTQKLGLLMSCKADRPTFLWKDCLHEDLAKGESNSINNSKFSAVTYYDKAKVNLLTNLFKGDKLVKSSTGDKEIPRSLDTYRKWLGAVDRFDRKLHGYLFAQRNIKWTQSLLKALLKIAINNTHCIAKWKSLATDLLSLELELIDHLTNSHSLRSANGRPAPLKRKSGFEHFPEKLEKHRDCTQCRSENKRSSTSYCCQTCQVPLHVDCFAIYHTK